MKLILIYLSSLIMLMQLSSCRLFYKQIACEAKPAIYRTIEFTNQNESFSIQEVGFRMMRDQNDSIEFTNHKTKSNDYQKLNRYITAITKTPCNSIYTLFYINGFLTSDAEVNLSNLKGVSVFSRAGNFYRHRLFLLSNNEVKEVKELDLKVKGISIQSMLFLQKNIVTTGSDEFTNLLMFKEDGDFIKSSRFVDVLDKAAKKLFFIGLNNKGSSKL